MKIYIGSIMLILLGINLGNLVFQMFYYLKEFVFNLL